MHSYAHRRALYATIGSLAWLMTWLGFQGGDAASSPSPPAVTEPPADYESVAATRPAHLRPSESTTTTTPTTTTSPPPPRPVTTPRPATSPQPCGGHLRAVQARWPADQVTTACRVILCESGGDPTAANPRSSASGVWQFLDSTWRSTTGLAPPASAYPAATQHDAALALWQRSGWRPWSCH